MTGFIFEGPDGAGKSFTALEISRAVNLPIHHSGGPPKSHKEIFNRALKQCQIKEGILDRSAIITDMVYSPVLRNEVLFENHWLKLITLPVIYCRPSINTILDETVSLKTKPHKNRRHLHTVKESILDIVAQYDLVMTKIVHIHFNRDTQTVEELCKKLKRLV